MGIMIAVCRIIAGARVANARHNGFQAGKGIPQALKAKLKRKDFK